MNSSGIKNFLGRFSFRMGIIVLAACIPFYLLSLAAWALPLSFAGKGVAWAIFFGLAKTAQYGGIAILGKEGIKRLKRRFAKKKSAVN